VAVSVIVIRNILITPIFHSPLTMICHLAEPWVGELRTSWKNRHRPQNGHTCTADLSEVAFIALMAIAGLGWLTYLSPPLAKSLSPYNLALGILGQESLMLWLLVMGAERTTMEGAGQSSGRVTQQSQ
jgi:hypothetical protein